MMSNSKYYKEWYNRPEVKKSIAERRKKKYHEDPVHREKILKRARENRELKSKEKVAFSPPKEFPYTLLEASVTVGKSPSTIREWVSKGYIPSPQVYKRRFVFTPEQITLMNSINKYLDEKGSKTGIHLPEFEDLKAFVAVNWS